jgi:hypothetical protein
MKRATLAAALAALPLVTASRLVADDVRHETDSNGVRWQITTQEVPRPLTKTHYVPQESTIAVPRYTTTMEESVRTYQVPVVRHEWVPGYQRSWNIFAPPTLSYRLMPVTRWETRTETVRIPITKQDYVTQSQVQHVPVTQTVIANETVVRRQAIGLDHTATGGAAAVARRDPYESNSQSVPADTTDSGFDARIGPQR